MLQTWSYGVVQSVLKANSKPTVTQYWISCWKRQRRSSFKHWNRFMHGISTTLGASCQVLHLHDYSRPKTWPASPPSARTASFTYIVETFRTFIADLHVVLVSMRRTKILLWHMNGREITWRCTSQAFLAVCWAITKLHLLALYRHSTLSRKSSL